MKDIVIIFKRKKLKEEYKLEPYTFLFGEVSNDLKIFKTMPEIVKKSEKIKGVLSEYNFVNNLDSLDDEFVFGFPLSIEVLKDTLKRCSETSEDMDLALGIDIYFKNSDALNYLASNYFDIIDKYLYYQRIKDNSFYTYTVNKHIKEIEIIDFACSSYKAIGEAICGEAKDVGEYIIQLLCENDTPEEKNNNVKLNTSYNDNSISTDKKKGIDVNNIYNIVTTSLKGQNEQVKQIISAIDINQRITNPRLKQNILICGYTGVGKTELFRLLSNNLHIPMVVEDATQYTIAGYVGKSIDDMLTHLLSNANNDIHLAERGILVVDEIDKKAGNSSNDKVATVGVLESLLKLMEGGKYTFTYGKKNITINTTNMTFVAMGAFSGLKDLVKTTPTIGFSNTYDNKVTNAYSTDNFNKYGLLPEFIGRCNNKIIMNPMNIDILIDILKNSINSPILLIKELFALYNVEMINDEEVYNAIATKALELNTGARSLFEIVFKMTSKARFQVQCENNKYKKLVLSKDTISDNNNYILK